MKTALLVVSSVVLLNACGGEPPPPPPPPPPTCTSTVAAYPDADGDGFGSAIASPLNVCPDKVPAGYTTANHLDCADGDARANPAAGSVFQTTPIMGPTANPWDFNCDSVVTKEWDSLPQFCNSTGQSCVGTVGSSNYWLGDPASGVPPCGRAGSWVTYCRPLGVACTADTVARTQGCF